MEADCTASALIPNFSTISQEDQMIRGFRYSKTASFTAAFEFENVPSGDRIFRVGFSFCHEQDAFSKARGKYGHDVVKYQTLKGKFRTRTVDLDWQPCERIKLIERKHVQGAVERLQKHPIEIPWARGISLKEMILLALTRLCHPSRPYGYSPPDEMGWYTKDLCVNLFVPCKAS